MRRVRLLSGAIAVLVLATSAGCSAGAWSAAAAGMSAAAKSPAPRTGSSKLMLFGGPGHEQYLGCLNCSKHASDSVFNRFGEFGSRHSDVSIFNRYGDFGSRYSEYSACSPYADDPPVIVDEEGSFYGRLTINRNYSQATRNPSLLAWVRSVCEQ